jgi:hypothetical protein
MEDLDYLSGEMQLPLCKHPQKTPLHGVRGVGRRKTDRGQGRAKGSTERQGVGNRERKQSIRERQSDGQRQSRGTNRERQRNWCPGPLHAVEIIAVF